MVSCFLYRLLLMFQLLNHLLKHLNHKLMLM